MVKSLQCLFAVVFLLMGATPQASGEITASDFLSQKSLAAALDDRATKLDVNSVSLTVFDKSGPIYTVHHGENVSADALFQAASMSKSVTAIAVLVLAQQHDIDLDADVRPYVTSLDWQKIKGGDEAVSLRQLLSHTAGATVSGFPGYRRSKPLPNSLEIVTGSRTTNSPPVRLTKRKNRFSYSGGGYQILQLFVEDLTNQSFEDALQELVLQPLGMTRSRFSQPIDLDKITPLKIAAAENGFNPALGVYWPARDTWHNYPEQAAAGLWTTSADFSKFGQALQKAQGGDELLGLPGAEFAEMFEEVDGDYGLGLLLKKSADGELLHFGHTGGNFGYRCIFRIYPEKGKGIVILTNSPKGVILMKEIMAAFSSD